MRCPPANNCHLALQCSTVLYVLFALERVQKERLTCIKSITTLGSSDVKTAPFRANIWEEKKHKNEAEKQNQHLHFCKVVDVFSPHWSFLSCLFFSIVCFRGRYLVWNYMEYYCIWFQFSDVPDLMTTMKTILMTIMTIIILTVTMKQYCEQHWGVAFCLDPEFKRKKLEEEEEEEELMNSNSLRFKKRFYCSPAEWSLPLLWRTPPSCGSPQGPQGRLSWDDNTCPCYVYITLMLTCNLSAVAAWRHSLCVCTEVATCEIVQYMQSVCACVREEICLSSCKKQKHVHAPSDNCTVHLHIHHTYSKHTHTHVQTHSSSCSPFSTLSWALPVTPHGDFALCQLSYSNKPLRHWSLRCHYWLQCEIRDELIWSSVSVLVWHCPKSLNRISDRGESIIPSDLLA